MIEFGLVTVDHLFKASRPTDPEALRSLRGHLEWQWDFVRRGRMRISSPAESLDILPGESVLSPPWLTHGFYWPQDSFSTSVHFFWPEAPDISSKHLIHIGKNDLNPGLLKLFLRYAPYSAPDERFTAAQALHLLLYPFLKERFPETQSGITLKEKTRRILEKSNYAALGVGFIAKKFGMSTNHFIRCFKAETKATPGRYLLRCRLDRAMELLQFSDMNITAVALNVGFTDLYTFSKAFRRHTGLSPKHWLQSQHNEPANVIKKARVDNVQPLPLPRRAAIGEQAHVRSSPFR